MKNESRGINMVSVKELKKLYGTNVCRQCANKTYDIHLVHTDCQYGLIYPKQCSSCKEVKNIVTGFKLSGYLKSVMKKAKKYEAE